MISCPSLLHLHPEEIAQADLSHVIADVLVVLQVCIRHVGVSWQDARVGLCNVSFVVIA